MPTMAPAWRPSAAGRLLQRRGDLGGVVAECGSCFGAVPWALGGVRCSRRSSGASTCQRASAFCSGATSDGPKPRVSRAVIPGVLIACSASAQLPWRRHVNTPRLCRHVFHRKPPSGRFRCAGDRRTELERRRDCRAAVLEAVCTRARECRSSSRGGVAVLELMGRQEEAALYPFCLGRSHGDRPAFSDEPVCPLASRRDLDGLGLTQMRSAGQRTCSPATAAPRGPVFETIR